MAKVVFRKIGARKGKSKSRGVTKTRAHDSTGQRMHFFTIDAQSATFKDDLTYVYQANVASARDENRKLFGSADGVSKNKRSLISTGTLRGRAKK
jgi:hypothetical protein